MPDTAAHVFGTFLKKYREKELKKNTSEQLRLRAAVKASFFPPIVAGKSNKMVTQKSTLRTSKSCQNAL
jgi:hypothetical protein